MTDCNYKTIKIPACFTGDLVIDTGLDVESVKLYLTVASKETEFTRLVTDGLVTVLESPDSKLINYFNYTKLELTDAIGDPVKLFGYDGYILSPQKNTNNVVTVLITSEQEVIETTIPEPTDNPVISLVAPNTVYLDNAEVYTEPGYTAMDDEGNNITADVVVTGTVDINTGGVYSLLYTVTDSLNRTSTAVRKVVVAAASGGGGGGLELGETSTTAYRGDRGKTAYDHSQITNANPHGSTTANVPDTADKRYVTDAEKTKLANTSGVNTGDQDLSNLVVKVSGKGLSTNDYTNTDKAKVDATSGTNTGDETTATIKTKLGITTLSGSNTGDQDLSGLAPRGYPDIPAISMALGGAVVLDTFVSIYNAPSAIALSDESVKFVACMNLEKAATFSSVTFFQRTTGAYTATSENSIGVYLYAAGVLTLVATTGNVPDLWKGVTNTRITTPFVTPYAAQPGQYFIGSLYNSSAQTTNPSVAGVALTSANLVFNQMVVTAPGIAALPASFTLATGAVSSSIPAFLINQ